MEANGAKPVPVENKNNLLAGFKASNIRVPVDFLFKITPSDG